MHIHHSLIQSEVEVGERTGGEALNGMVMAAEEASTAVMEAAMLLPLDTPAMSPVCFSPFSASAFRLHLCPAANEGVTPRPPSSPHLNPASSLPPTQLSPRPSQLPTQLSDTLHPFSNSSPSM